MVAADAADTSINPRRDSSGCVRMAEASDATAVTSDARVESLCIVEPESTRKPYCRYCCRSDRVRTVGPK